LAWRRASASVFSRQSASSMPWPKIARGVPVAGCHVATHGPPMSRWKSDHAACGVAASAGVGA